MNIKQVEKCNGYINRSTWLAVLHCDNPDEGVYKDAQSLALKYDEMVKYWDKLKRVDSTSYSYPFHQHKAIDHGLKNLLNRTKVSSEINYRIREIDLKEFFNHFIEL